MKRNISNKEQNDLQKHMQNDYWTICSMFGRFAYIFT